MEVKQIREAKNAIYNAICGMRLKEAFTLLEPLLKELHDASLLDEHYDLELTYKSLLKYASEGSDDPQRQVIYNHVMVSLYGLADKVTESLLSKFSGETAYDTKRELNNTQGISIFGELSALELILDESRLKSMLLANLAYPPEYGKSVSRLFNLIWLNDNWTDADRDALRALFSSEKLPWHVKALMCGAMLLSLLRVWNHTLVLELFNLAGHDDYRVRMRALVNLLIVLYNYDSRLYLYPEISAHLKLMRDDEVTVQQLQALMVQLIRTRETEMISEKLQNEIIPEVMKMQSVIRQKFDLDNMVKDAGDDKNPEWSEVLADSPQLLNKLEEISKWQMEGADVFLNTFQMLKHFPFFNQLHNWLIPFYMDHPLVQEAIVECGDELKQSSLFENIGNSSFLCNSDKYSLFLGIPHMPSMQRQMLGQMFSAEMEQLSEIESDELLVNPGKRDLGVSNQYVQDLYRFFKVYPQKRQFPDVFAWRMDFYKTGFFKVLFPESGPLRQLGEYLFRKNYMAEAQVIFMSLSESDPENVELLQKIAFCVQKNGNPQTALAYFLKADLLKPNSLWTLKRIARCYADLKDYEKALEYYLVVAKLDPDNLQAHAAIGHCLLETSRFDEALQHYFRVEYLDAANTKVWRPIAWCSFVGGKFVQAEKYYQKMLMVGRDPGDLMGLGHVMLCSGKIKEALCNYRDSIRLTQGGFAAFFKSFEQDVPYLLRHGVAETAIPIYMDQIRYLLEE